MRLSEWCQTVNQHRTVIKDSYIVGFVMRRLKFTLVTLNEFLMNEYHWKKFSDFGGDCWLLKTTSAGAWQNQQNDLCTQWRLRSVWASLLCALRVANGTQIFFMWTAKTLITLCGCPDWSESSLDAHVILLDLSYSSSYCKSGDGG